MRVLHVITGLAAGGAETQLQLLVRHSRYRADVVTLYNAGSVAGQLRADGVAVTDLGMRSNRDLRVVPQLAALIRRGRYDVVHTHLYRACLYGRIAARLAGVGAVVATEHSLLDDQLEGRAATRSVRELYRLGERLGGLTIAVSEASRANLLAWGVRPDRVVTVPNGMDMAALAFDDAARARVRKELGVPGDAQVVGGVGRLHPGKRFDVLLSAVAAGLGPSRRLLLVGDGPERLRLEQQAARLGISDFVHLVGEQRVAAYLSAMDLLVSPSRYETFGLAVLEGLASGLEVRYRRCPAIEDLGTPVPGAAELPEDDGELPKAVDRALAGPRPGRRCPEELRTLRIDLVAARIDALYEQIAGQRDRRNS